MELGAIQSRFQGLPGRFLAGGIPGALFFRALGLEMSLWDAGVYLGRSCLVPLSTRGFPRRSIECERRVLVAVWKC